MICGPRVQISPSSSALHCLPFAGSTTQHSVLEIGKPTVPYRFCSASHGAWCVDGLASVMPYPWRIKLEVRSSQCFVRSPLKGAAAQNMRLRDDTSYFSTRGSFDKASTIGGTTCA